MTTFHESPQISIDTIKETSTETSTETSIVNTSHLVELSNTSDTSEEEFKSIDTSNLSNTSDEQIMFSCTDIHNDFYKKKANKYKCKYEALFRAKQNKINNDITNEQ